MLGTVLIERYELQTPLGKQAGRQTWRAWDRQMGEPVILKLVSFNPDFTWDDLKLFEREAATLRALDHPAIPRYLDFFEVSLPTLQGFALVQSVVVGQSLSAHLQAGRSFSEADLRQLAEQLLDVLLYLHGRHPAVIHRDIKPSNIMLGDRSGNSVGQPFLVDFGSVQTLAAREGGTITIVGTYCYMPPEQFGGRATPASDLYSLGATLIYLATGHHPADIPQVGLRLQFQPLSQLSPEFTAWLTRIVEPGLNERFSSADLAFAALQQPQKLSRAVMSKPAGSEITRYKTRTALTIELSNRRAADIGTASLGGLIIFMTIGFLTPFGLWMLLVYGLWARHLMAKQRLSITKRQISLERPSFWGLLHSQPVPPSPTALITELICHDEGDFGAIEIWAGTLKHERSYEIGRSESMSRAEAQWLADEISLFLDLPITTIASTPGSIPLSQLPPADRSADLMDFSVEAQADRADVLD